MTPLTEMMVMVRALAGLLLALVGFFGSVVGVHITEDDPRWNCHTMGNHKCGKAVP